MIPLPWSLDGADNFLTTPADLLATIQGSGFETVEWVDETAWVLKWFQQLAASLTGAGAAPMLPALLISTAPRA